MSDTTLPAPPATAVAETTKTSAGNSTLTRVFKYTAVRSVALFFTVVIGVYLTILIANMGGHVDQIRRSQIREGLGAALGLDPQFRQMSQDERNRMMADLVAVEETRLGLDQPFVIRSMRFLGSALTLNLGRAESITSDTGSGQVRLILLERLPVTLVLFATANFLTFFVSIFFALTLSRNYGSFFDRATIALAPTSAAPGWFYGLFLIIIFAAWFRVLPFGGMVAAPPPPDTLGYAISLLQHLILPVTALVISSIFLTIYSWRTFFLIYSSEDYVDMAKAKGLPSQTIERRYILRPTLPTIITNFALALITVWSGGVIIETVFNWPGLGRVLFTAIGLYDTPVIVGSAVIYAYLLAATVFVLDFVYALVDPRVKVGGEGSKA